MNGSVVPNRADVATVHFCHAAFEDVRRRTGVQRASKTSRLYELNERATAILYRAAERGLYRKGRRRTLVAVSEGLADELRFYYPSMASAVVAIPNAVDTHRFRPDAELRRAVRDQNGLSPTDLVCVFVGGDWDRKGLGIAIRALATSADWHLVVVGSGDVERYSRLADQYHVRGRVRFVGVQSETAPFFAAADAMVLPSVYETSGLAAFEAAATAIPIIVTRFSGLPEEVTPGVDGFVVDREPTGVSACLELLKDQGVRESVGQAGRALVTRWSWQDIALRYQSIYESRD